MLRPDPLQADLKRGLVQKTMALLAACAIVVGLTACSSPTTVAGCSPTVSAGNASKVITAAGKINIAPKVKVPTPLFASTTQVSTLIAGHGAALVSGQPVLIEATIINGRNGDVLQTTDYTANTGIPITAGKSDVPAVSEAIVCAQVGSRIAIVASAQDGHQGKGNEAAGIRKNDSFVYVVDIKQAFLPKATGEAQVPVAGRPTVVTAADGAPGITLPAIAAPKSLQTTMLKSGTGARLSATGYAVVKYTAVSWSAVPAVFDSTWKTDQTRIVQLGSATLSPGLTSALAGKRVGSQVLVVIPAALAAAADGSGSAPAGETVVYVVDILGIPG